MGHSMGGHGALTLALKNPDAFKSASAFAPICNPTQVPWGQKAFAGYLGEGWQEAGKAYDATELVKGYSGPQLPVLIDTGADDEFLQTQVGAAGGCVCWWADAWGMRAGAAQMGGAHAAGAAAAPRRLQRSSHLPSPPARSCTRGRLRRRRAASCSW